MLDGGFLQIASESVRAPREREATEQKSHVQHGDIVNGIYESSVGYVADVTYKISLDSSRDRLLDRRRCRPAREEIIRQFCSQCTAFC